MMTAPRLPEDESEASTDAGDDPGGSISIEKTKAQAREKPGTSSRYRSALMPEQQMVSICSIFLTDQASRLLREVKRAQAPSM